MKINLLNDKLNLEPEKEIPVTKKRFFEIFYRLFYLKEGKTLSDNEIELMSSLSADIDSTISKNNLPPVIKKLNEKGLMDGKELSKLAKAYTEKFTDYVQIVFPFKIVE